MPAQFESANTPVVGEPNMMNGDTTPYNINDEIVISGFSGEYLLIINHIYIYDL